MPICFVSVFLWVMFMPGPRYAYGITWVMAATSMAIGLRLRENDRQSAAITFAVVAILAVPTVAYRMGVVYVLRDGSPFTQIPFRGPGPDHGFYPPPVAECRSVTTRWGLEVNVAISGAKCWDCPVPCVGMEPDPSLRLRREGDLGSGFVSDRWGVFGGR